MTKQEAIDKCFKTLEGQKIQSSDISVRQLVIMLEALGLIKFEEEKIDKNWDTIRSCGITRGNMTALKVAGFMIVKAGNYVTARQLIAYSVGK